jgi:hypothetical protein
MATTRPLIRSSKTSRTRSAPAAPAQPKRRRATPVVAPIRRAPTRVHALSTASIRLAHGDNQLMLTIDGVSLRNKAAVEGVVRRARYRAVDLAPTFEQVFQRNRAGAVQLAEAYATTIADPEHHRELFQ